MRLRPELRKTVGRSGCVRNRAEMSEYGKDRKVKDIAEARITCRYRIACEFGWSSAYRV